MPTGDYQQFLVHSALCAKFLSDERDSEDVKKVARTYNEIFPEVPDPKPADANANQAHVDKYRPFVISLFEQYGFSHDFRCRFIYEDVVFYDNLDILRKYRTLTQGGYSGSDCKRHISELVQAAIDKEST